MKSNNHRYGIVSSSNVLDFFLNVTNYGKKLIFYPLIFFILMLQVDHLEAYLMFATQYKLQMKTIFKSIDYSK